MKYVLIIGLNVQHYKNNLTLQIYADNHLIDQTLLCSNISNKKLKSTKTDVWKKKFDFMFQSWRQSEPIVEREFPEKIFYYEINDKFLGKEISIELADSNSNYTNSFMSKSNMIFFHNIFLFPKCLLSDAPFKKFTRIYKKLYLTPEGLPPTDDETRNPFNSSLSWPGGDLVLDGENQVRFHWHGGFKKIRVPLIKKFNMYMISPNKNLYNTKKYIYSVNFWFLHYLHTYNILNISNENK